MKKTIFAAVAFALAGSAFAEAPAALAVSAQPTIETTLAVASPYTYELGVSTHRELYEEFTSAGKLMQEEAMMTSIRGSVSRKVGDTGGTVILSGAYSFGDADYTGSYWGGQYGDLQRGGLGRYSVETSLMYKYTSPMWNGVTVGSGLGYRRLVDNLQEGGPGGYKRSNDRYYLALSLEKEIVVSDWTITPAVQYKHLLKSEQFSDIAGGVTVAQNSGYGAEVSMAFATKLGGYETIITPFYRTWDIQDSEVSRSGLYEPRNTTTESGVALTIKF